MELYDFIEISTFAKRYMQKITPKKVNKLIKIIQI